VKISKIAGLSPAELASRVIALSETEQAPEMHIDRLVMAMIDLDEENFEKTLNELIGRFGFENAILEVVYPFLEKIGVLWLTGNITPLQEHFITNLMRQKLHELGLLFSYYVVKKMGFRAYYMGQRVPYEDVRWFCVNHRPVAMITNITTYPAPGFVEPYLQKLCVEHPAIQILAAGHNLKKMALKIPSNLHILDNAQHLKSLLQAIKVV
jgi:hypothetical protein